jgi:hypothetical protein
MRPRLCELRDVTGPWLSNVDEVVLSLVLARFEEPESDNPDVSSNTENASPPSASNSDRCRLRIGITGDDMTANTVQMPITKKIS